MDGAVSDSTGEQLAAEINKTNLTLANVQKGTISAGIWLAEKEMASTRFPMVQHSPDTQPEAHFIINGKNIIDAFPICLYDVSIATKLII